MGRALSARSCARQTHVGPVPPGKPISSHAGASQGDLADRGGIPKPPTIDELLELPDGQLGAAIVSMMSVSPAPKNFAALGRVIKEACAPSDGWTGPTTTAREDLALALRRPKR